MTNPAIRHAFSISLLFVSMMANARAETVPTPIGAEQLLKKLSLTSRRILYSISAARSFRKGSEAESDWTRSPL